MFASVGADGSVRMFDLRHLEHSTIIYEDPQHHPLLRLCWNKQDPNYLATMAMDGMEVRPEALSLDSSVLTRVALRCWQLVPRIALEVHGDVFDCHKLEHGVFLASHE